MKVFLIIPLLLALIISQGHNLPVPVCMDQLGTCLDDSLLLEKAEHCPCGETDGATTQPCSQECPVCHLDHAGELYVYSGTGCIEREHSSPLYAARVIDRLGLCLREPSGYVSRNCAAPPRLSVAKEFAVRLL